MHSHKPVGDKVSCLTLIKCLIKVAEPVVITFVIWSVAVLREIKGEEYARTKKVITRTSLSHAVICCPRAMLQDEHASKTHGLEGRIQHKYVRGVINTFLLFNSLQYTRKYK